MIHKISFNLEGKQYTIDIPEKEYFMVTLEVDSRVESIYPDLETIRFYDNNGNDITVEIERSTLE